MKALERKHYGTLCQPMRDHRGNENSVNFYSTECLLAVLAFQDSK